MADGNGFTGFNPTQAQNDITNYINGVEASMDALAKCVEELYGGLEFSWCSPKAEEFSKEAFPELFTTFSYFIDHSYDTYNSLVAAYNTIAAKHSVPAMTNEDSRGIGNLNAEQIEAILYDEWGGNPYLHAADPKTGVVGMDISAVKTVLSDFNANASNAITAIASLPTEIAFYDADGSQQLAFKTNVEKYVKGFEELFNEIVTYITEATTTEADNITLAARQSADTLAA